MTIQEFQHLARLSVVGNLDAEEEARFEAGRRQFGEAAECFLREGRLLSAALALSLTPREPEPGTKRRLMARIHAMKRRGLPRSNATGWVKPPLCA